MCQGTACSSNSLAYPASVARTQRWVKKRAWGVHCGVRSQVAKKAKRIGQGRPFEAGCTGSQRSLCSRSQSGTLAQIVDAHRPCVSHAATFPRKRQKGWNRSVQAVARWAGTRRFSACTSHRHGGQQRAGRGRARRAAGPRVCLMPLG